MQFEHTKGTYQDNPKRNQTKIIHVELNDWLESLILRHRIGHSLA